MSWYKKAQFNKKLLKNIEKKKQVSLQKGWSQEEIDWASNISLKLNNPSYFQWLLEQTRNGSANIQTKEDDKKIFDALHQFDELMRKKLISEDINKLKTFSDLYNIVDKFSKNNKSVSLKNIDSLEGADVIYDENYISVIKVTSPEAGEILFKDSGWCVKDKDTYTSYGSPFYLFRKYDKNYALYHHKDGNFKNVGDTSMKMNETVPLLPSFKFLFESGIIPQEEIRSGDIRVIPELLQHEKTINNLIDIGELHVVGNMLDDYLEYATLIDKFHLTPEIFEMVKSKYLKKQDTFSNANEINDFYNSMPTYLNQAGIVPTYREKSTINSALYLPLSEEEMEDIEKGYLEKPEMEEWIGDINKLYRSLHKLLKTRMGKQYALEANQFFLAHGDSTIHNWGETPEEFKKECLEYARDGAAKEVWKSPEIYYSREKGNRYADKLPEELITDQMRYACRSGLLNKIKKKPYKRWENILSEEFRTDDVDNMIYESRLKEYPRTVAFWNDIDELFKTKELWNVFHATAIEDIKESYWPSTLDEIPDEFMTDELIEVFTQKYPSDYKGFLKKRMTPNQQEQQEPVVQEPAAQEPSYQAPDNQPDELENEKVVAKSNLNWYKKAQYEGFFSNSDVLMAIESVYTCPCCGGGNIKSYASDEWHRCKSTLDCPLANKGGYFSNENALMISIVGIGEFSIENEQNLATARQWANSYKRETGSLNLEIGDIGIIVNSGHSWNNGKEVIVVKQKDDEYFTAMSTKPTHEGLYFLYADNIMNFDKEWLRDPEMLIGQTVIVQGQAILHSQNRQDILTDGKRVKIVSYVDDKSCWGANTTDLEMYSYYEISASTFKKTKGPNK